MAPPQAKRYTFADTFADLLTWDEGERVELIDGDPVMHASPLPAHQAIVSALNYQLYAHLRGTPCRVYPGPIDIRLFQEKDQGPEDVDTVVVPDLCILCDLGRLDQKGYRGAPAFVVEVLSPSSRRHDKLVKHSLYEKAGVKEYWIVDPEKKMVLVHLLEEDGHYPSPDVYTEKDTVPVHVLEDCVIDLAEVFSF